MTHEAEWVLDIHKKVMVVTVLTPTVTEATLACTKRHCGSMLRGVGAGGKRAYVRPARTRSGLTQGHIEPAWA
ncbi:MAG: hypothetical protein C7B45_10710 [Sulfobacillus acidophilus]|uniref:Uncharacterized protein n=1 Tax=Sulfobacillus acidophilus TaxID=53633 RepID=A0A2T2WGY4_9FIRM|nr:MAG: hypothetical protein C7B45_10710 [Sulfobacillus acidophilus]